MARITCVDPDSHPVDEKAGLVQARTIGETGQIVPFGETVEIPDDIAGRPTTGKPGEEGYDPGEGLLAQGDVWQLADEPAPDQPHDGTPASAGSDGGNQS